jgi:hypothetical protein
MQALVKSFLLNLICKTEGETGSAGEQPVSNKFCQVEWKEQAIKPAPPKLF